MIATDTLDALTAEVAVNAAVAHLRGCFPGLHFTECSEDDVLTVHPFGNTVNKATMSGSELATYLGQVATKTVNTGGYAQFGGINTVTANVNAGHGCVFPVRKTKVKETRTARINAPGFAWREPVRRAPASGGQCAGAGRALRRSGRARRHPAVH